MINKKYQPEKSYWSGLEQTVQRRREAIFLPHFLPVTTWQTNQLWATNWVIYWQIFPTSCPSLFGKPTNWQQTGSYAGKMGNQASAVTGWQTLANEILRSGNCAVSNASPRIQVRGWDQIYPELHEYRTCVSTSLSLAFDIF